MQTEKRSKPMENCQEVKVQLINPLLRGLKVAGVEEMEMSKNRNGVSIALDTKKGDRIFLLLEPTVKPDGNIDIETSIYKAT